MLCEECKKLNAMGGFMCGQAFTDWTCHNCNNIFTHHNTATPKICKECSETYGLCEECGKQIL